MLFRRRARSGSCWIFRIAFFAASSAMPSNFRRNGIKLTTANLSCLCFSFYYAGRVYSGISVMHRSDVCPSVSPCPIFLVTQCPRPQNGVRISTPTRSAYVLFLLTEGRYTCCILESA